MKMAKKLASGIVCAAVALGAEAGTLPAGYAEHEYLESTGTQYIDTGVVITPTMAVEADVQFTDKDTKQQRIFGNSHNGTSDPDGDLGTGHLNFDIYIQGQGYLASAEAHAQADYKTQTDAGFLSYGKVETQRAPGTAIHLI